MKELLKIFTNRVFIIVFLLVLQVTVLVGMAWRFAEYFVFFHIACIILSLLVVLKLINGRDNPAYKIAWIVVVLLAPISGVFFYLMFGNVRMRKNNRQKMTASISHMKNACAPYSSLNEIAKLDKDALNQSYYIQSYAYIPAFQNTYTEYLSSGERKFEELKQELEKAERYIFLEYFIIQEGIMWNSILEILVRKAAQGVDVRVIYDDIGCMLTLPYKYNEKLEKLGIKCCVFNRFIPLLSTKFNNRDHRKIAVIDGHTAFTGGINLSDEYINITERYGHWKDTALLLKGEAAWGLTVMFLYMWTYLRGEEHTDDYYRPDFTALDVTGTGFVQPYWDSPMDDESLGATIYLNMINKAKNYIYIITPYLVIDDTMVTALTSAAKCGIDVRIITPHIADHWYVHSVGWYFYEVLIESGVKIYEYTPGFVHAKSVVADDAYGVVGTVNLDYRSMYLHYECGVWLYHTESIAQIKNDFLETLKHCKEISLQDCDNVSWFRKVGRSILMLFSPLM